LLNFVPQLHDLVPAAQRHRCESSSGEGSGLKLLGKKIVNIVIEGYVKALCAGDQNSHLLKILSASKVKLVAAWKREMFCDSSRR